MSLDHDVSGSSPQQLEVVFKTTAAFQNSAPQINNVLQDQLALNHSTMYIYIERERYIWDVSKQD